MEMKNNFYGRLVLGAIIAFIVACSGTTNETLINANKKTTAVTATTPAPDPTPTPDSSDKTSPYVLTASSYVSGGVNYVRVIFSEAMNSTDATNTANYVIVSETGACTDAASIADTVATKVDDSTYDLTVGTMTTAFYKVCVSGAKDSAGNSITDPNFATFRGTPPVDTVKPQLDLATAINTTTIELTFSEPVDLTTSQVAGNYSISGCTTLTLSNPLRQTNTAKVRITNSPAQEGCNYLITVSTNVQDTNTNGMDTTANFASFAGAGSAIVTITDGAQFENPFGDGTSSGFSFVYNNRVYIGPNKRNANTVRFEANGANLITVNFDAGSGYDDAGTNCETGKWYNDATAPVPGDGGANGTNECQRYDFGHPTTDTSGGPASVDGIGYFQSVTVNNIAYLAAGVQETDGSSPKLNQIFLTSDTDATLNFGLCAISTPANVKSTSALGGGGSINSLFVGMASDASAQRPGFDRVSVSGTTCADMLNPNGKDIAAIGGSGTPANPRAASNNGLFIGIDQIFATDLGGTTYLALLNNGGMAVSLLDGTAPSVAADFGSVGPAGWARSGTTNTRVYNKSDTLQPWEKSFSAIAAFGTNTVFVGRNRCVLTAANDEVNCTAGSGGAQTPELWRGTCSTGCTASANWTWVKVFDAASFTTGNGFASSFGPRMDAISAVVVNGSRLYVAMDSDLPAVDDGVHLVYTTNSSPTSVADFTEVGRATAVGADTTCNATNLDGKAFGKWCGAKRLFSATSINQGSNYYMYMSVGDNTNSLRVFRQVD